MRNQPPLRRMIPITAIRHLYRLLRDFPMAEFHLAVARELCRRPEQMAKLIAESREHCTLYDNRDEGFHNRGTEGLLSDRMLGNGQLANMLVQQLVGIEGKVAKVEGEPQYDFRYVDYQISPLRTTRSEFENGESGQSSGAGGMDILLSNQEDRTPIVGEIKADTDVNPFFGLIQSLMYAVELSTPSQRTRLQKAYPDRFAGLSTGPGIDIYLILLRYPKDMVSQQFLTLTGEMSAYLMAKDCPISNIVRRIVALQSPMSPTNLNQFTVAFAHGD